MRQCTIVQSVVILKVCDWSVSYMEELYFVCLDKEASVGRCCLRSACVCVLGRPVNYVLTWLSVVGPVVGLEVPLKYSTELHESSVIGSTKPE